MTLLICLTAIFLLFTTALGPMLQAAEERADREFEETYRRFQLRAIRKYNGLFSANPQLQGLSLEEIEKHFRVQNYYDDIGR